MKPLFIPAEPGALFGVFYPPLGRAPNQAILYIPPFAEEMNKSRRMASLQARAFADRGYAVLLLDLFGSGDSHGEFGAASWEIWLDNVAAGIGWLKRQGAEHLILWGLRTGALLALDFASQDRENIERLLCWQPVLNGDTFITQFLRLRVAAAMLDGNAPREKTADLKQQLLAGHGIEVAGYWLRPELVKPLLALRADRLNLQAVREVAVLEVAASEEAPVSLGNSQLLAGLQAQNIGAALTKVAGNQFWTSQEISEAPALLQASNLKVEQWL